MKKVWILLFIGIVFAYLWTHQNKQKARESNLAEITQSELNPLPVQNVKPESHSKNMIPSATAPSSSAPPLDTVPSAPKKGEGADQSIQPKPTFPSIEEFTNQFKKRQFREWLSETRMQSPKDASGGLDVAFEGGVIQVGNQEIEFRYSFDSRRESRRESCVSILPPNGKLILGTIGEATLKIGKLHQENAWIVVVQDEHYFVRYTDFTESRGIDEHGAPRNPLLTFTILYYQRQPDGKIIYQGKLEKLSSPDPDMKLKGADFCRYSYGRDWR